MTTSIALCVTTYLRPLGLARLLDGIDAMERVPDVTMTVLVVDNDGAGSARPVVDDARRRLDLDIVYEVEPQRGITFARNTSLRLAAETGHEWIGWLDDDEVPHSRWLVHMFETQSATKADVVSGPSAPIYEPGAPQWIIDAGPFVRERFTTGQPFKFIHARTSGVILRASATPPEGFDNRLALVGGEDRVFFTRMHRSGASFVWDDRAVVDEWVPSSRVSLSWVLRRWFRIGVTRSLTLLYLDNPSLPRRLRRVAGGLGMGLKGVGGMVVAVPKGRSAVLAATRLALLGFGASFGALGLRFREYRRTHGQ